MSDLILITGGAGFIGTHTIPRLLEAGHRVRVLDNLDPQVHGPSAIFPRNAPVGVEYVHGDVRDSAAVCAVLDGVSSVLHLAALTGVGQSMYESARYISVNVEGTAVLWDEVARRGGQVRRVVLSSSRAIYGEGAWRCPVHGDFHGAERHTPTLENADWSVSCPQCGRSAMPRGVMENDPPRPISLYGWTKKWQEDLCAFRAPLAGVTPVILRYFNVFGPGQAARNPYTGVLTLFARRALDGKTIELYEEGTPIRDWIHVRDVARANAIALDTNAISSGGVFNIGTGSPLDLAHTASALAEAFGTPLRVATTKKFRVGDVAACFADATRARNDMQFRAEVPLVTGLREVIDSVRDQACPDGSDAVATELAEKGLLRGD